MSKNKVFDAMMVLALAGLYFFSYFQRVAVPGTIFNDIQSAFAISAAEVTALGAIYLVVYAAMQPFIGILADRFGGVKVVIISGVLLCAGSLLFPLAQGQYSLYCSRALVGLGASAMYLCLVKETVHSFGGKNFAPIFGFLCLLGYSGGLAGTKPFRLLVEWIGWRNSCMAAAVATCAILFLVWLMKQKVSRPDEIVKDGAIWSGMVAVLQNRLNYPLMIVISFCFSIYFSLQSTIGLKFLEDFCGITPLASSGYTFIMMLFIMASLLFSGIISKSLGNKRKGFVVFNAFATLTATLMLLAGIFCRLPPQFFLAAYILLAIAAGVTPVTTSLTRELNAPGRVGTAVAALNAGCYAMVAIITQVIGKILDVFNDSAIVTAKAKLYPPSAYIAIFGTLTTLAVIAAAASFYCRETNGRNINTDAEKL